MSKSVPDKETISLIWKKIKNRSISLESLTKDEYDALGESKDSVDVAYFVQSDGDFSLMYRGINLVPTPVRGIYTREEFDSLPDELKNNGFYIIRDS